MRVGRGWRAGRSGFWNAPESRSTPGLVVSNHTPWNPSEPQRRLPLFRQRVTPIAAELAVEQLAASLG